MSNEQWGHGYWKGYDDGKRGKQHVKYVCTLGKDKSLKNAYKIIEKHENVYVLESLWDIVIFTWATGKTIEFDEDAEYVDSETVELSIDDMSMDGEKPIFFYSQKAFLQFLKEEILRRVKV